MKIAKTTIAALGIIAALSSSNALASATYSYTGNAFSTFISCASCGYDFTTANHVEFSFTLNEPITANSNFHFEWNDTPTFFQPFDFSITSGAESALASLPSPLTSRSGIIDISTDSAGMVNQWFVGSAIDVRAVAFGDITSQYVTVSQNNMNGFVDWSGFTEYSTSTTGSGSSLEMGALAAPSAVPIPAAVWLLGSGLLSLVGVARRKTA